MIVHKFDLNMVPCGRHPAPILWLNQNDADYMLEITLTARMGVFTLSAGTTAEIRGTKSDGSSYSASAEIDGNVVTVKGDSDMTSVAGSGIFEITLTNNGKCLSTENFYINIEPIPLDDDTTN